jgi:hypothetical protein
MEITIRRGERQYGPYGEEQVREMLLTGSVVAGDEASAGGAWVRLDSLLPPAGPPDRSHAPEIALGEADLVASGTRITLWNPEHAASAAVLGLGITGPVLHALNWKALGRADEARQSWGWAAAFGGASVGIVIAAPYLMRDDGTSWAAAITLVLLVCWWFGPGKRQSRAVKSLPRGQAVFRSSKPVIAASLALTIGVVAISLHSLETVRMENTAVHLINERLQERLGDDALECVKLKLGKKLADDLWQAEAMLDNGQIITMTVRRMEGDVVSVRVNPASFLPLGLTE